MKVNIVITLITQRTRVICSATNMRIYSAVFDYNTIFRYMYIRLETVKL